MRLIDADKFLAYLIFSKHIDSLTCEEVKEATEMCKVDVLDNLKTKIRGLYSKYGDGYGWEESRNRTLNEVMRTIDEYRNEVSE